MNIRHLFILPLTAALLAACQTPEPVQEPSEKQPTGIPVRVETVSPLEKMEPILAVGQVVSGEDLYLGFRTGGVISRIYVREGQQVKQGQLLAELDLTEVNAQVVQATAALEKAERDLERVSRLYQDTVATLEQVQDLTTKRDVDKAQLQLAESQQRHAKLIAPSPGRILKKMSQSGEVASPGAPVFQLGTDGDTRILKIGLADVDVVQVNLGDEAEVTFDAWPGIKFPARISDISPSADPRTGTYAIDLTFQKQPRNLRNGFVGKATIDRSMDTQLARIPLNAIARAEGDSIWVFVPDANGEVQGLKAGPVLIADDYVAVPWEQVVNAEIVTEGAAYLQEGVAVQIIPPADDSSEYLGQR